MTARNLRGALVLGGILLLAGGVFPFPPQNSCMVTRMLANPCAAGSCPPCTTESECDGSRRRVPTNNPTFTVVGVDCGGYTNYLEGTIACADLYACIPYPEHICTLTQVKCKAGAVPVGPGSASYAVADVLGGNCACGASPPVPR